MNDRFKFRFYDNNKKIMIDENTNNKILENEYGKDEWYWCIEAFMPTIFDYFDPVGYDKKDFVIMQCTGLKDKNGKLIYEGDIIVIPNQYPFYDYKNEKESQNLNDTNGEIKGETILNYVGVVEYIFNGWQYVLNCVNPLKRGVSNGINYHINEQGFEEDENSCYEVIGNIYENKELLEEE
jgi:uncharacterized phage protein (TIGR01671 family)